MGRWDTYLGHDRPLPMGEQSHREYHSGDPEPEGHCEDCGGSLYEDDYHDPDGLLYCWACSPPPAYVTHWTHAHDAQCRQGAYTTDSRRRATCPICRAE